MTLRHHSPSSIKSFLRCPRRWAWEKVEGVRVESAPSAALGTRVHEILEAWLRDGTTPDLREEFSYAHPHSPTDRTVRHPGQIARTGLHLLPAPGTVDVEAEMYIGREHSPNGPYFGRLDGHKPYALEVLVLDHKTTSDPRYALTEETLRKDVQAVMYAAWAMIRYGVVNVRLRWIYSLTKKPYRAWAVEVVVHRDEIAPVLETIDRTAAAMWRIYSVGVRALDVPPNPSACSDFGGCPHRARCALTPQQTLEALMSANESPDLDALLASMGIHGPSAVGAAPPPPPPLPEPGPINPPEAPPPAVEPPEPRPDKPPAPPITRPDEFRADRPEVKAYAVQIGAVDQGSRLGLPALWEKIREAEGGAPRVEPIPPPPPPPGEAPPFEEVPPMPGTGALRVPTMVVPSTIPDYPDPVIVAGRKAVEAFMDFLVAYRGGRGE
jgi:CRISPR/Cas system-associated exonuclease Cas4 (RecB family)